jgi:perosamine synthetase
VIDLTKSLYGKYNGNEMEYVLQALDSDNSMNKEYPWPQRFEEEFCSVMGVKYSIACNSGTSGLHAALVAAGVGPGDEVISPALTVIMDAYAIIHVGATPVFADVDPGTHTIDPEDVRKKITPKTKAIITVSLQGLPVDIDPIMELAEKKNIIVIEDSAQTLFGMYKGRIAGTLGHIGVFSFENKKHLTCGSEGGMIVSNDEKLAQRARKFSGIGYKHMTARAGRTSLALSEVQDPAYERFDTVGLNYRMTEVSAAVGLAQLERVHSLVSRRQAIARMFDEAVAGCDWIVKQEVPDGYIHSYYTYAVNYFGNDKIGISWKMFYNRYREMGGDGFYGACKVPYLEPVFENFEINGVTYKKVLCPVAEEIQPKIMQFKTNYRNLDIAKKKAEILKELIDSFK